MNGNLYEKADEILERQKQADERASREHNEIIEAISKANANNPQTDQVRQAINRNLFH